MTSIKSQLRAVEAVAEEFGYTYAGVTRGGHLKFTREGCPPVFAAATPSDWRGLRNLRSHFRRAAQS